jgi:hypothetical protein
VGVDFEAGDPGVDPAPRQLCFGDEGEEADLELAPRDVGAGDGQGIEGRAQSAGAGGRAASLDHVFDGGDVEDAVDLGVGAGAFQAGEERRVARSRRVRVKKPMTVMDFLTHGPQGPVDRQAARGHVTPSALIFPRCEAPCVGSAPG